MVRPAGSGLGFETTGLEEAFRGWREANARQKTTRVLWIVAGCAAARALAEVPEWRAIRASVITILTVTLILFNKKVPKSPIIPAGCLVILLADFLLSLPTLDALLPIISLTFISFTVLELSLLTAALITGVFSAVFFTLFTFFHPLLLNELLSLCIVVVWTQLISVYAYIARDRLGRGFYLSARNAFDAENSAEEQGNRMNRLLSSFLPDHLILPAAEQINTLSPRLYTEHYQMVSYVYGRIVGLESVLTACAATDAARVLRELEIRVAVAARSRYCVRVAADGVAVVAGIPSTFDPSHAEKALAFARDFALLISSFRDATTADVSSCIVIASGQLSAGVIGSAKWHYDVVGPAVDEGLTLFKQTGGTAGIWVTEDTFRLLPSSVKVEKVGELLRTPVDSSIPIPSNICFPINKRFSLVTVPQAVNRLLQSITTMEFNRGTSILPAYKRKAKTMCDKEKKEKDEEDARLLITGEGTLMDKYTFRFKNQLLEDEFHKEMDKWLIPALAISIFFLVVYGLYHMLVMPRLLTSLVLVIVALSLIFFILLLLYINYFYNFSQFITRTASGHSVTILLILSVLLLCGVVNTFSCPQTVVPTSEVCRSAHFSAFSFALFILTTTVFVRFSSLLHFLVLLLSLVVYTLQIFFAHPPIGPKQFGMEFDVLAGLIQLGAVISFVSRDNEKLMRLDFLSAIKCSQECSTAERLRALCGRVQLNIVPRHLTNWLASRQKEVSHGELLQHVHHTMGMAYISVEGIPLQGEQGINTLNFIFSYFDQILPEYKGIEKVKSWNRYYVLAAGLLPDTYSRDEAPRTIGDLLQTLALLLIHVTSFAAEKQFQVHIGMDCGSVLSVLYDADRPHFEIWGDTVERSRKLSERAASQGRLAVSEEIYLALRPRNFIFSAQPFQVQDGLNAYTLHCDEAASATDIEEEEEEEREAVEFENVNNYNENPNTASFNLFHAMATQHHSDMTSSIASSYSSELRSLDGGETDSEIEWISPETALTSGYQNGCSDYGADSSRAASRTSSKFNNYDNRLFTKRLRGLRGSLPRLGGWFGGTSSRGEGERRRRGSEGGQSSSVSRADSCTQGTAADRLDAAARRVERMLRELQDYGEARGTDEQAEREEFPFPTTIGSMPSIRRPASSACHTEYDNDSEADTESEVGGKRKRRNSRKNLAERTRRLRELSAASSLNSSLEILPLRQKWRSGYSIGYEDEYEAVMPGEEDDVEMEDSAQGIHSFIAAEQMRVLSRDIRRNFGEFQLATFGDTVP